MAKIKKRTKGDYKEYRNPSLPARFSRSLLDKCPSNWYNYLNVLNVLNVSLLKNES